MLVVRNRHFAVAAALVGSSGFFLTGRAILEALHTFGETVPGGFNVSAILFVVSGLLGISGWVVVATGFRPQVDRGRLLTGGVIVAASYAGALVGWAFREADVLGHIHNSDYRAIYLWSTVSALLMAAAVGVVVSGLAPGCRRPARALRTWIGAIGVTAASVASTLYQLSQRSFYSSEHAPHELRIAASIEAISALGVALAAFVFVLGSRPPAERREASLAVAAAGGAAATLVIAGGETVIALAFSRNPEPAWLVAVAWFGVAGRLLLAAALIAVALGASSARGSSEPAYLTRS